MYSLKWRGNKYQYLIANYYYLIVVAVYSLSIYLPFIRTGVTMAVVLLYLYTSCKIVRYSSVNSGLVFAYFIYCILSIQGYFYNGMPVSIYMSEISTQILPIIFFFIPFNKRINRELFYGTFMIAIAFAIILGLYYYIYNPPAYVQYMLKSVSDSYEGNIGNTIIRFNSLFGSIIMGTLSLFMLIILIDKFWNRKFLSITKSLLLLLLYTITLVSIFLTAQRSAMVLAVFCIAFMYICSIIYWNKVKVSFTLFNITFYAIVVTVVITSFQEYFDFLSKRLESVDTAFEERDSQWIETFQHSKNFIFGTGLGSAGHRAMPFTNYFIADGGLFKLTAELGTIGMALFLFILLKFMLSKIKYFPELFREYLIVFVCLLQSVGSNTIVFQQVLPVFWFSLGSIASYYKIKKI